MDLSGSRFDTRAAASLKFTCEGIVEKYEDELIEFFSHETENVKDKLCSKRTDTPELVAYALWIITRISATTRSTYLTMSSEDQFFSSLNRTGSIQLTLLTLRKTGSNKLSPDLIQLQPKEFHLPPPCNGECFGVAGLVKPCLCVLLQCEGIVEKYEDELIEFFSHETENVKDKLCSKRTGTEFHTLAAQVDHESPGLQPPLVQAIFKRDAEEVRVLLHKKEDVNALDQERRTPLHAAAFLGDVQIMELLINSGASVNAKDHVWFTPLHRAAASRNEKAVALLLKKSAEVSARDKFWQTPLHVAAANRATKCAEAVIPLLSSVNVADRTGRTALHHAAHSGHIENKEGKSPLHMAAIHGRFTRSQILIQNGGEIDCVDKYGNTPLHIAAKYGHELLISTLMTNGADTARGSPAKLALKPGMAGAVQCSAVLFIQCSAVQSSLSSAVQCSPLYPVQCSAVQSSLSSAVQSSLSSAVQSSLSSAVQCSALYPVPLCSAVQRTPLYPFPPVLCCVLLTSAAVQCSAAHASLSIPPGAVLCVADSALPVSPCTDVGFRGCFRYTWLCSTGFQTVVASYSPQAVMGCEDCVCALLDHDAFALCRDFKGRTPLHLAAACGHVNLLGTLLQAAFNTDPLDSLLDYSGYTPAHWAACHGHEDCLEVLLEHKPFSIEEGNPFTPLHYMLVESIGTEIVNIRDAKGRTPLHAAAFSENLPSLQLLLSHGAEVNAVDQAGRSAIMVAADCGQTTIVDILLSRAKADLTLLDENKNTALHLACSKGHEMCALLILRETHEAALINATNTALQMPLHIAARNGLATVVQVLLSQGATVLAVDEEGHTPALACAPNKDVADCLALILSTMKPFPPKDAMGSPFGLNLLKNCGIAAACSPLQPNGSLRQRSYGKERRHGAIGLDGCFTD
ncbi:UNVERIFIED_CONTAM: hypothetical protein FKN15_011493 [Acipenser sinensis]